MTDKLLRLHLSCPPEHADLLTGLLYMHAPWGWQDNGLDGGRLHLVVHLDRPEQSAEMEASLLEACPDLRLTSETIDNADWTSAWRQYFTPIPIGTRFVVLPAWMADEPRNAEPILIEPKMAFGTGHHQTTALCLSALDHLCSTGVIQPGQRFLDLGTGSGILAIAAAKLGLHGKALDIDPVARDNAEENIALNHVADRIDLAVGSIADLPAGDRFDCILANILANPLIDMAEHITGHLTHPGVLVLSGILREQADHVAQAYTNHNLPSPEIFHSGEWTSLIFHA